MNIVVLDPFDIDRLGFCTFIQSHSSYNLLFDTSSPDDLVYFIASNTKQVDICFLEAKKIKSRKVWSTFGISTVINTLLVVTLLSL